MGDYLFLYRVSIVLVLTICSGTSLPANDRLLKAVEQYEAVWIGKTTVLIEDESGTSWLRSIRDDRQVSFSRLDVKAGKNELVNFKYISLPLGQSLSHVRALDDLDANEAGRPYLGRFIDRDDPEELVQSLGIQYSVVDAEFLSILIKNNLDSDSFQTVSNNQFRLTLESGTIVEIGIDDIGRVIGLESEADDAAQDANRSVRKSRIKSAVQVTYDAEDTNLPSRLKMTLGDQPSYTLRLESSVDVSGELTDRLHLPGIEIPDGVPVKVADHENDSHILLDGRIVTVVDSQVVADAQAARQANSRGAWLAWYTAAGFIIVVAGGLLLWLRRSKGT